MIPLLYAESISAWSNQGSAMCLVSIINQQKLHSGNIYISSSIYLIIQLEINPYVGAIQKYVFGKNSIPLMKSWVSNFVVY